MRRLILCVVLILSASSVFAQSARIGDARYMAEMDKQINASQTSQYLHKHADIFKHILHLRVCEALGIDPAGDPTEDKASSGQQTQSLDTSFVRNISKNSLWQNETSISINRANRKLIIAGANDANMYSSEMPSYTTTDAGNSWKLNRVKETGKTKPGQSLGDPMIVCDDSGMFYYSYLITPPGAQSYESNIVVATSADGKVWKYNTPLVSSPSNLEDKQHIAIDNSPTSPHRGRVYVAWMRFSLPLPQDPDLSGLFLVYSDDHCKTWSEPQQLQSGTIKFVHVRTGPGGELYIGFSVQADVNSGDPARHYFARSFDGAASFDIKLIADFEEFPFINILNRPGLKGQSGFRSVPYVAYDVDRRSGKIHLLYGSLDDPNAANPTALELYTTSEDKGATWAKGSVINATAKPEITEVDKDRFMPWVSIDQKTGDIHSIFYSSESDNDNILTTINHLKLNAGLTNQAQSLTGTTFDPTKVIPAVNNPPFIGDYIGCDANDSVFAATWTENRPPSFKDGEVFAYISSPNQPKSEVRKVVISSSSLWLSPITPNPVTSGKISVQYYFPKNTQAEFALYDALGKKIVTLISGMMQEGTSTSEFILPTLSAGTYFLKLTSPLGVATEKLIVE